MVAGTLYVGPLARRAHRNLLWPVGARSDVVARVSTCATTGCVDALLCGAVHGDGGWVMYTWSRGASRAHSSDLDVGLFCLLP